MYEEGQMEEEGSDLNVNMAKEMKMNKWSKHVDGTFTKMSLFQRYTKQRTDL